MQEATLWLTALHMAEWTHAVAQHVFQGKISADEAKRVYRNFERDRADSLWIEVGISEGAFESCIDLARRHGARLGVRTLDSLHVAQAVDLGADYFWTFDKRQALLAKAAGLDLVTSSIHTR